LPHGWGLRYNNAHRLGRRTLAGFGDETVNLRPTSAVAGLLILALLAGFTLAADPMKPLTYPPTRTTDDKDTLHGVTIADPYRWLEKAESKDVQEWMAAQDKL